ncbi:MAG: hypothetical protein JXL81_05515, partial [Deltaproteobacteria bacterium]|nr:hypothetical protein [Deltaproteobacteria bacterium]
TINVFPLAPCALRPFVHVSYSTFDVSRCNGIGRSLKKCFNVRPSAFDLKTKTFEPINLKLLVFAELR